MTSAIPPRPWPGPRPGPFPAGPVVEAADEQALMAVDLARFAALARGVLLERGVRRGELSLTFVDEDTIAELNRHHLGGDGPTDVLAFPLDAPIDAPLDAESVDDTDRPDPGGGVPVLLGDVVVCPAQAERNTTARSVSIDEELALLVVHGVLHVLGMDHAEPDEAAHMQATERDLLARLHVPPTFWAVEHPLGTQSTRKRVHGSGLGPAKEAEAR